jgi:hypothetical protein
MGATTEDDELLLVFWRLVGGAVGEPPVLFAEAIFYKNRIVAGLKNDRNPLRKKPKIKIFSTESSVKQP